ncbi:hypothetical protein GGR53DRAFT_466902 [Hypoxylon sp. FL1150]|nr:hypothetical protein GGR53DRAFT_466902 [Hypoxylon sp. FL1150]
MQALTTVFKAPSWCTDRFVVYIDNNPYHSSTLSPTRGWADPSFSQCVPSQYTESLQVFSPGVCPDYMTIARTTSHVDGDETTWSGGCCQSGFSDMTGYFCTSTVTTPMRFVLQANVSTTDIYTTLSDLWIEHDQMTVAWQASDLTYLPPEIRSQYREIMGLPATTPTESSVTSQSARAALTSTIATATPTIELPSGVFSSSSAFMPGSAPAKTYSADGTTTLTGRTASAHTSPTPTSSSGGSRLSLKTIKTLAAWSVLLWMLH